MARYFFTVADHTERFVDEEGEECPSLEAAQARAVTIARELAEDADQYRDYTVVVTDEAGKEVARVPVPRK